LSFNESQIELQVSGLLVMRFFSQRFLTCLRLIFLFYAFLFRPVPSEFSSPLLMLLSVSIGRFASSEELFTSSLNSPGNDENQPRRNEEHEE